MKKYWSRFVWFVWKKPLIFFVRKTFPGGFATDILIKEGELQMKSNAFLGYSTVIGAPARKAGVSVSF